MWIVSTLFDKAWGLTHAIVVRLVRVLHLTSVIPIDDPAATQPSEPSVEREQGQRNGQPRQISSAFGADAAASNKPVEKPPVSEHENSNVEMDHRVDSTPVQSDELALPITQVEAQMDKLGGVSLLPWKPPPSESSLPTLPIEQVPDTSVRTNISSPEQALIAASSTVEHAAPMEPPSKRQSPATVDEVSSDLVTKKRKVTEDLQTCPEDEDFASDKSIASDGLAQDIEELTDTPTEMAPTRHSDFLHVGEKTMQSSKPAPAARKPRSSSEPLPQRRFAFMPSIYAVQYTTY